MSVKDLMRSVAVALVFFSLSSENYHGAEGAKKYRPSKEEDLEFEEQLNILNKPPVKSFRTKFGDLYDCIDIYKQPAFDHPMLKDHKIQMKPSLVLQNERIDESTSGRFLPLNVEKYEHEFHKERCPTGTVRIRRTKKEELVNAKYFSRWINSYRKNSTNSEPRHYHYVSAQLSEGRAYYGAAAKINTQNPFVEANKIQFSTGQIWIQNGPAEEVNSIEFGWAVHPLIFGDNQTRVFGFWTADGFKKTGCYNMLCPGFMQTNPMYGLGEVLRTSTYGPVYTNFRVKMDVESGNWWLYTGFDHAAIGYWPGKIFSYLVGHGSVVKYGGIAGGIDLTKPTPPLGNGKLVNGDSDFDSSCHMLMMKVYDDEGLSENVDANNLELERDTTVNCYNEELREYSSEGTVLFFGGPGGNCPYL